MQAMKKDHARLFDFIKSLVLNLPTQAPKELTRVGSDPKFDNEAYLKRFEDGYA